MTNRLKELRTEAGLVVWGLATQANVSPTTVTAIEKHGFLPRPKTQQRIADALGVPVYDIWPNHEIASTQEVVCA